MEKSSIFYENYCKLRDKLGITDYKVAKDTGINQGNFVFWKTRASKPRYEYVKKLADYFSVSVEELMGEKEANTGFWENDETAKIAQKISQNKELKLLFSSCQDSSPEDLKAVHAMLLALKSKEKRDED